MNDTGQNKLSCTSWCKSMSKPSLRKLMLKPDRSCLILLKTSLMHFLSVAFSCKRRGFSLRAVGGRMAQTAAHLIDHIIPRAPVRQWVLSLPIPLRYLLAAHPRLLPPILQVIHRAIPTFLINQAGLKRSAAQTGATPLIQCFGSAANLNIHRL